MTTILSVLEVSTAHLQQKERDELLPASEAAGHRSVGPLSVYFHIDEVAAQAIAWVGEKVPDEDPTWRAEWPTLAAIRDRALELGVSLVYITPTMDLVDGLPTYDDEPVANVPAA